MENTLIEGYINSNELITALKSIELQSIDVMEVQLLKEENKRLRTELYQRHLNRLNDLRWFERKKQWLLKMIDDTKSESREVLRLQELIVMVNNDLDNVLELIFQMCKGFMTNENVHQTYSKLEEINKVVMEANKKLYHANPPEKTIKPLQTTFTSGSNQQTEEEKPSSEYKWSLDDYFDDMGLDKINWGPGDLSSC